MSNLGVAYTSCGQPETGIRIFENLLDCEPDNPSHILNLAIACGEAGEKDRAVGLLRDILARNPPDPSWSRKAITALRRIEGSS
jgi:tetratricopeptide (TPR) repeat protein